MIECPKCEHKHEPSGLHEEDEGDMECEACGFPFSVQIEYDPDYITTCIEHEFGELRNIAVPSGKTVPCRFCQYCDEVKLEG